MSSRSTKKKKFDIDRVPTGIARLDEMVGGGLPRKGLILVAGDPGTGKTILASHFIYSGAARFKEKGLYVTFNESDETLKQNLLTLGWDLKKLEDEGVIRILEMPTGREQTVEHALEFITKAAEEFEARRFVIDSISALTLTSQKLDAKVLVSLLHRSLSKLDCTTILITETPWGSHGIGSGVEEFIADGIILLTTNAGKRQLKTILTILKMRATDHDMKRYQLTISKDRGINLTAYIEEAG